MKKNIFALTMTLLLISSCKLLEEDPNRMKYRDADPELIFRGKAKKPPNQEEIEYVVARYFQDKYGPKLHTDIESLCYKDSQTLQVVQRKEDDSLVQWYLAGLQPNYVTIYYNLDQTQKAWMMSRVIEYFSRRLGDDSKFFPNKTGAIIHLPKNFRLENCQ